MASKKNKTADEMNELRIWLIKEREACMTNARQCDAGGNTFGGTLDLTSAAAHGLTLNKIQQIVRRRIAEKDKAPKKTAKKKGSK